MLTWRRKHQSPQLHFELSDQQTTLIDMRVEYQLNVPSAICQSAAAQFHIAFDGFWRHKVLVRNEKRDLIALVYSESWFSETSILRVSDKTMRMKFRDNPRTELIIYEKETEPLLACRLLENEPSQAEVQENMAHQPPDVRETLLGIAWFVFFPVVQNHKAVYAL